MFLEKKGENDKSRYRVAQIELEKWKVLDKKMLEIEFLDLLFNWVEDGVL